MADSQNIDRNYERYYAERARFKVYPTEFVVRTFLAKYPRLKMKRPESGDRILDVGFGDGRNTVFLCELDLKVFGIEITQGIVDRTQARIEQLGYKADLRVGRNSMIPFEDASFSYLLACHCCYYCDEGETLLDNLREYARVLVPGGYLVASVANRASYIFDDAQELEDGSLLIKSDPYGTRDGYRLHAFSESTEVEDYFSPFFTEFCIGSADNDYYGITERVFWVVCRKDLGERR